MNIDIKFNSEKVLNKIDKMINLSKNSNNLLKTIDKSVLEPAFIRHINESKNPSGANYAELKSIKDKWRKPLIKRGIYRASFYGITQNNTVSIRNTFYYAKYHESLKPRHRLPMRKAVYLDNQMRKDINLVVWGAFKNA